MSEFDIGHVPNGWKRGEPLEVRRPPPNGQGCVSQELQPFDPDEDYGSKLLITFHDRDRGRVQAWLDWWFEDVK